MILDVKENDSSVVKSDFVASVDLLLENSDSVVKVAVADDSLFNGLFDDIDVASVVDTSNAVEASFVVDDSYFWSSVVLKVDSLEEGCCSVVSNTFSVVVFNSYSEVIDETCVDASVEGSVWDSDRVEIDLSVVLSEDPVEISDFVVRLLSDSDVLLVEWRIVEINVTSVLTVAMGSKVESEGWNVVE